MDPMVAWETKEGEEYLAYSIYVSMVTGLFLGPGSMHYSLARQVEARQ